MTATTAPAWLSVIVENLPRELTDDPSWYPGLITPRKNKPGKWNKMPANPETAELARWKDPATRRTFSDAYMAYQRDPRFACIGYLLHDSGIIGIDLDDAFTEDDTLKPWAASIVDSFPGAYWERSISDTGLRGFCRGTLPDGIGGCKRTIDGCSVELYSDVRYLAVTGHALQLVDALPTLQEAVDALYARLAAGRSRATGTAVRTGLTGRVTDLTPAELAIIETVMGGRWSATMSEIWGRDELDAAGASEEDWVLAKEIVFWAIRAGLKGDHLALIVERIMRAGPYRVKWDEPRGLVSWLAQDVANAVRTTQDRLKTSQGQHPAARPHEDDEPINDVDDVDRSSAATAPAPPESLAQKAARLERENRQLRATNAVQMTVIRAHNDVEQQLRAQVEKLHRQIYADYRLAKVTALSSSHKDTMKAIARVATSRAEHFDNDAPIITAEQLAKEIGKSASTARAAADLVCKLPGAPVKRVSTYRDDGTYGRLTTYELAVRDPVEILEQFVVIAENLTARQSSRPRPPRCRDHPTATVLTFSRQVCSRCRRTLASTFPGEDVLYAQNATIAAEPTPAPVVVRSTPAQNATIAGEDGHGDRRLSGQGLRQGGPDHARRNVMARESDAVAGSERRGDDDLLRPGAGHRDEPPARTTVAPPAGPASIAPPPSPRELDGANGHARASVPESMTGVEVSEEVKRRDVDYTGLCAACQVYGVWPRVGGVTRCGACQAVIHTADWATAQPALIPDDPPPATNGRVPEVFST